MIVLLIFQVISFCLSVFLKRVHQLYLCARFRKTDVTR